MLNRRILRIKVFKVIYSRVENPALTAAEAEAELSRSCEATRDLYVRILSLCSPLTAEAAARIEAAGSKFNPTEDELHPNLKFVRNAVAPLLDADPDFCKQVKKRKISWENDDMFLRNLYESVRERPYFKKYLDSPDSSLAQDAALFASIFASELPGNPELEAILEDNSLYWNDELEYVINWCCSSLDSIGKGEAWNLPELYMSDVKGRGESDKAFSVNLLRAAMRNFDSYCSRISAVTPKWDANRICATDLALIVCGLAEADTFSGIDFKTTINEFVEISKFYSTPESRSFVNGVLDKLINKQ
ncbi:MAG: hypothetical protein IJS66_00160 [Bacteroidales bacterium]|nr:hypothetical protein [Bacteroidales bacterium]